MYSRTPSRKTVSGVDETIVDKCACATWLMPLRMSTAAADVYLDFGEECNAAKTTVALDVSVALSEGQIATQRSTCRHGENDISILQLFDDAISFNVLLVYDLTHVTIKAL